MFRQTDPGRLDLLDDALLEEIMLCLPPESIAMTASACTSLHRSIASSKSLWQSICSTKWQHCHSAALKRDPLGLYATGNGWDSPKFVAGEVNTVLG